MGALLLLLLLGSPVRATTIVGADYGNTALSPANGDVLSGTFTNVSQFTINAGDTVFVNPSVTLVIYTATAAVYGTLDGSGRGQPGGSGGAVGAAGVAGFNGGPTGVSGQGGGATASSNGGGGGGAAGAGGVGAGASGGSAGAVYGSTGVAVSFPLSSDDLFQGSGGGGGGGGGAVGGGGGAAGGAAIYIEAASMTITGSILASGATATAVADASGAGTAKPGGGGGGSGGALVLRVTNVLDARAAVRLAADGGKGGNVDLTATVTALEPGGGGSGGRLNLYARQANWGSTVGISTAAGSAGSKDTSFAGSVDAVNPPGAGAVGVATFGVVASPPSGLAALSVYVTSIDWNWTATPNFGDGATPAQYQYRLFASTATPMPSPTKTSLTVGATETALTPNTTYYRVVTAFTDWGDSMASNAVSTHTLADRPVAAAFTSVAAGSLQVNWTGGANPSYTQYEIDRSTSQNFAAPVSTSYVVAVSSTPTGLSPNTTYFFRVRGVNIDNVPTEFTATMGTATLGAVPANPQFGQVFVTSASYVFTANGNPAGTTYLVQVSSDNFFTLVDSSRTLSTSATFFTLTPNTNYFYRSFSINRNNVPSAASALINGASGNLTDLTAPSAPGTPVGDRQFSYDGTLMFLWASANSSVGILDYNLLIGSTAGGNDVFSGNVMVTSHTVGGLATGKTYYAEVRARANNGVIGPFSNISQGVPVFIPGAAAPLSKPINWPNPFSPASGATQIGVFMEQAGSVTFKIFTLNGQLVHQESRDLGQGNQVMTWTGASDSGRTVAPGGYIGVVEKRMGSSVQTQKFKMAVMY